MPLLCLRDPSANCSAACAGVKPCKTTIQLVRDHVLSLRQNHNGKIRSLHIPYSQCQTSCHSVSRLNISYLPNLCDTVGVAITFIFSTVLTNYLMLPRSDRIAALCSA